MNLPAVAIIDEEECIHTCDLRVMDQEDGSVVFHGIFTAEDPSLPVMDKLFIRLSPEEATLLAEELLSCAHQPEL
ncbi:MAG: hypothetical protein HQL67_07545 [Magnetococcales bacterium]|nr:hypothetical protein [Magnetococcales bacterium]